MMLTKLGKKRGQKGFTLIELMIVIAIIGILAAIAIPQFAAYRERGYIAAMKGDVNSVRTAEEAYFVDNNAYIIATVTDATGDTLANYGIKAASPGVTVTVTVVAGPPPPTFVATAANAAKTTKTVKYDSATGKTTTEG